MILIIDDEEDMLAVVRRMLQPLGQELRFFSEPREALAALARLDDVSVVLSDLDMPNVSGTDLLERARQVRPSAVRLLMTGRGSYESAIRAINAGEVFRYIRKPFEVDELRAAVGDAVVRHHELAIAGQATATAARRQRQLVELDHRRPGIAHFERDEAGDYAIDPTRYLHGERFLATLGIVRDRH